MNILEKIENERVFKIYTSEQWNSKNKRKVATGNIVILEGCDEQFYTVLSMGNIEDLICELKQVYLLELRDYNHTLSYKG